MLEFLTYGFPMSLIIMVLSFMAGMGVATITIGTINLILGILFSYMGVIRVLPLFKHLQTIFFAIWPRLQKMDTTLKSMYNVKGVAPNGRAIYMFHPHGSFSTSFFFHQMARVTSWPKEAYARATITYQYYWIPFAQEILDALHAIPNRYGDMKEVLEGGESLAVIPGGLEEINERKEHHVKIVLAKRKGIFRLALETGTPLVPVLTYGENELYSSSSMPMIVWLNTALEKILGIQICVPSWDSVKEWLKILSNGVQRNVNTVIGEAIPVEKKEVVKDTDIQLLKKQYIAALRKLYKETKPEGYSKELEVI